MSFIQMGNAWRRSGERQQEQADAEIRRNALLEGLESQRSERARSAEDDRVQRALAFRQQQQRQAQERSMRAYLKAKGVPEEQHDAIIYNQTASAEYLKPAGVSDDVNWQTEVDEGGNVVRINPRTGKTEYVNAPTGGTMKARPPASLIMPPSYNIMPSDQGIVAVNPRNPAGGAAPVRGPTGQPLQSGAQATEYERKAAMLMPRLQQAASELSNLGVDLTDEKALLDIASPSAAASLPGIGPRVGESFSSEGRQRARNALENVLAVSLRLESGANITEEEALRQARNMLPTFFDQEGTKRQKLRLVAATIQGATSAAGRATPATPDSPKASGLTDADLDDIANRYRRKP